MEERPLFFMTKEGEDNFLKQKKLTNNKIPSRIVEYFERKKGERH